MTPSFSAWKAGLVYYLPALAAGAICLFFAFKGYRIAWAGAAVFLLPGLFALFFFRDPPRTIKAAAGEIVSPADGTIVAIEDLKDTPYYAGPCRRISIFLSVFSCHVNRAPFAGTVRDIRYKKGQFKNAMKAETSECNESNAIWFDTDRGPMTVRQISGAIARRIVCATAIGDALATGQKFGMIKFGSRTELYLPPNTEIRVKIREKVRAGTSIVARFSK